MPELTPPNADNLQIPRGIARFKLDGESSFRDLGEVSSFTISHEVTRLDKFSGRSGIRRKIKSPITELTATAAFTMDEPVAANVAIFALGDADTDSDGNMVIKGLSKTQYEGVLQVEGTSDIGPKIDWEGRVSFSPAGDFTLISDEAEWNGIEVEAEVLASDDGSFGEWTVHPAVSS